MANTAGLNTRSKRKNKWHCFHLWLSIIWFMREKYLAKRTLKSTQVNGSLQNQNLRMDLRRVAKLRKLAHKSNKSRKFHAYHWLMRLYNNRLPAINLCRLALVGQTVRNLRLLASKFELDHSQHKPSQVVASRRKLVAERNASPKLASTCESVWPGLKQAQAGVSWVAIYLAEF